MPARHFDQITADLIFQRLLTAESAHVEWLASPPIDADEWSTEANDRLASVRVAHVSAQLELHDIFGENPTEEVDAAICLACEPLGMPDCAAVTLKIREKSPGCPPVAPLPIDGPTVGHAPRPQMG